MQRGNTVRRILTVLAVVGGLAVTAAAGAPGGNTLVPGKAGGVLNVLAREDLTEGFSIHESVTISTIWPAEPCFNSRSRGAGDSGSDPPVWPAHSGPADA